MGNLCETHFIKSKERFLQRKYKSNKYHEELIWMGIYTFEGLIGRQFSQFSEGTFGVEALPREGGRNTLDQFLKSSKQIKFIHLGFKFLYFAITLLEEGDERLDHRLNVWAV